MSIFYVPGPVEAAGDISQLWPLKNHWSRAGFLSLCTTEGVDASSSGQDNSLLFGAERAFSSIRGL